MGTYCTAQICRNGHMITSDIERSQEIMAPYCRECGASTLNKCEACNTNIRGYYDVPGVININRTKVQSFCHQCGKPYPWTEAGLKAACELADELDDLTDDERERLKQSLPDLVSSGPRTELAVTRVKKALTKVRNPLGQILQETIVNIASETAKKLLLNI